MPKFFTLKDFCYICLNMKILYKKLHLKPPSEHPNNNGKSKPTGFSTDPVYRHIKGKSGNWYIQINAYDLAGKIFFSSFSNILSEGFGGRELEFKLEDGSIAKEQGPWHSNSTSLFEDTGFNLKNNHLTWGIIGLDRDGDFYNQNMIDVLYVDKDWIEGSFDRIKILAQKISNKIQKPVIAFSQSSGGSSTTTYKPI